MEQKQILRVIIIDDAPERAEELINWLRRGEYYIRPRFIPRAEELADLLRREVWDMLLVAGSRWPAEVSPCAAAIKSAKSDMVLMAVDDADRPAATEAIDTAIKAGAADIVPRRENRLMHSVNRSFRTVHERRTRRALKLALNTTEARCRNLILASPTAIACVSAGGHIVANTAWLQLFGYAWAEDLASVKLEDLIAPEERKQLQAALNTLNSDSGTPIVAELTGIRADKGTIKLNVEIESAFQENMPCLQVTASPRSSDAKTAPAPPPQVARPAPVTSAPPPQPAAPKAPAAASTPPPPAAAKGPDPFTSAAEACITVAAGGREQSALLCVEIVRWKQLQAAVGEAMKQVLTTLENLIKPHLSSRYPMTGIDEHTLAVLMPKTNASTAKEFATGLLQHVDEYTFKVGDRSLRVNTQIGIVRITDLYTAYADVLEDARQACRTGLLNGHRVEVFGEAFSETQRSLSLVGLESFIDRAIKEDRLSLVYQPLLGLKDDPQPMYEAFLRMRDETGANVPVAALFAAARVQDATSPLDHWIVDHAITILQNQTDNPALRLFIKLERESVKSESLLLAMARWLRERHVAANRLVIEVSEITLSQDPIYIRAFFSSLRKLGCGVAVEHFGIGLSAQKLLEGLPVDYIKIDAMLIAHMTQEQESANAVQAIVKHASGRGIATIAEWVKDAPTLMAVINAGIDYAQGVYVQEPSPVMDFDFASRSV
ncbi:MAG TPA: EAL domain-containing protein [Gammaproteobacteria bacterium]|nr:EAL domain-containing protein [Gammaproteobacteria bacterium]